ncbi:hypothetical protein GC176_09080 [bacterium]|nr:hypothetical protein [bacterium]
MSDIHRLRLNQPTSFPSASRLALLAGVAGMIVSVTVTSLPAQEIAPPPPLAVPSDTAPPAASPSPASPSTFTPVVPLPEPTAASDADVDVTLRGPLHEAFARTVTYDPVPGPLVNRQPPEPINEVAPDQQPEGSNIIWIPGYWAWNDADDDFLWISGLWRDVPPGRRWVPGYWAQQGSAWQWFSGFWVDADQQSVSYLPQPPESLELGPTSPAPGDNFFWVPGCWEYDGATYRWRPGYWSPFQTNWVWTPASYYPTPLGYVYCNGYWDYQLSQRGAIFASLRFRRYGSYSYRPSYVLNPSSLLLHLFVDSRTGFYLYGDWYGYGSAIPWYQTSSRDRRYDPLLTYNRWAYGSGYTTRLAGWTTWFNSHPDSRPRHTARDQDAFARQHHSQSWVNQAVLGQPLSQVVSNGGNQGHRFQRVDEAARNRMAQWNQDLSSLHNERVRTETGHGNAPGRQASNTGQGGRSELRLPQLSPGMRGHSPRGFNSTHSFGTSTTEHGRQDVGRSGFGSSGNRAGSSVGSNSSGNRLGNTDSGFSNFGRGFGKSTNQPSGGQQRPDASNRSSNGFPGQPATGNSDHRVNRNQGSSSDSRNRTEQRHHLFDQLRGQSQSGNSSHAGQASPPGSRRPSSSEARSTQRPDRAPSPSLRNLPPRSSTHGSPGTGDSRHSSPGAPSGHRPSVGSAPSSGRSSGGSSNADRSTSGNSGRSSGTASRSHSERKHGRR